jgi:hypothetical protein
MDDLIRAAGFQINSIKTCHMAEALDHRLKRWPQSAPKSQCRVRTLSLTTAFSSRCRRRLRRRMSVARDFSLTSVFAVRRIRANQRSS